MKSTKNSEPKSPAKIGRLNLHRETLKSNALRTGVKTGLTGPGCQVCGFTKCHTQ